MMLPSLVFSAMAESDDVIANHFSDIR